MNLAFLSQSLRALRQPWPHAWPGLPRVWQACLDQLRGAGARSERVARVLACGDDLAQRLEAHGAGLGSHEPAYHNRLHTADTLVCLTVLLGKQRAIEGDRSRGLQAAEALMLLAMLGHDAWHPGTRNLSPFELEAQSAAWVLALMRRHGLSRADQAQVKAMILATEPLHRVKQSRDLGEPGFSLERAQCRAMMVCEADIMSSALPRFAPAMTQALAQEWGRLNTQWGERLLTRQARHHFLQEMARFSSPAAVALGLPALVQRQLGPKAAAQPA